MDLTEEKKVNVRIKISPETDKKFREVSKENFNERISHRELEITTLEKIDKKSIKKFGDELLKPEKHKKNIFPKRVKDE